MQTQNIARPIHNAVMLCTWCFKIVRQPQVAPIKSKAGGRLFQSWTATTCQLRQNRSRVFLTYHTHCKMATTVY